MEECDCIIPAAGRSERMGRWKPVLPFGGRTIIESVVAAALRVCPRVLLVTGYRGDECAAVFRGEPRVIPVVNEDWPLGMFSSIRLGMSCVSTSRFFVTLGDMPWITAAVYAALLHRDEADVVFPVHAGSRGHPVLFRECVRPAVASADPRTGSMRTIAASFRVGEVSWPDDSVLRDIDTASDLR
jgi:molybdenum cofactor cytidylyltransferase